ncbi:MAG: DNA polymerase III subunit gamma/tau [Acidimicrobiales bacterium]|nr:DNA polymerase III subunit gamma/tau [Acidimicrobiales bacterium]
MAYQSLYRRYRPQRFGQVRGQEHLVRALQNAVREGRVGHAYLFSGPRGTGKTSTARILAKVLNCENVVDGEPCCACESCLSIEQGTSFDVHELDAASNNGVEAIRDLINKAALGTPGRTKVYILDEVHMLSAAASNALLKTLEEPPEHVVFVLATTDPQKVLPTIRSRTQHFDVHLLPAHELRELVDYVVTDAGLEVDADAIDYVLRAGGGSARDTLSALDQVVAAGGVPAQIDAVDEIVEALCDGDTGRALLAVEAAMNSGRGPRALGEQLISRLRDVFLAAVGSDLERLSDRDRQRVGDQAKRLGAATATRALEVLGEAFVGIQDAPDQRIPLEVALVRLTRPGADLSIEALVERIERLERAVHQGIGSPVTAGVLGERRQSSEPRAEVAGLVGEASRPADAARSVLASKRARPPAGEVSHPSPPSPPSRRSERRSRASGVNDQGAQNAAEERPAARLERSGDETSALPTREQVTLAWGDVILGRLKQRAKARFGAGRWLAVEDGFAVFGLPNPIHRDRCEEVRPDVEAALEAHFGMPVPVRLVVDSEPSGTVSASVRSREGTQAVSSRSGRDDLNSDPEEGADLEELIDAGAATTPVERIADVFPGAELVDE